MCSLNEFFIQNHLVFLLSSYPEGKDTDLPASLRTSCTGTCQARRSDAALVFSRAVVRNITFESKTTADFPTSAAPSGETSPQCQRGQTCGDINIRT